MLSSWWQINLSWALLESKSNGSSNNDKNCIFYYGIIWYSSTLTQSAFEFLWLFGYINDWFEFFFLLSLYRPFFMMIVKNSCPHFVSVCFFLVVISYSLYSMTTSNRSIDVKIWNKRWTELRQKKRFHFQPSTVELIIVATSSQDKDWWRTCYQRFGNEATKWRKQQHWWNGNVLQCNDSFDIPLNQSPIFVISFIPFILFISFDVIFNSY